MNTEVRKPQIGDKVADCREHASLAQEALHGTIVAIEIVMDDVPTVTIQWPGNPTMPEMTTPESLHWSEGGKRWFIPRLPTEHDLIVDAGNPDRVGRVFFAMGDTVGAVWSTTVLDLTNAMNVKGQAYDEWFARNDSEPTAEDLNLDIISHADLTYVWDYHYWVLVDLG